MYLRLSLIKSRQLLNVLNNINPAIQFTTETSDSELPVLYITINKEEKKVFIAIYLKQIKKDRSPSNQTTTCIA